MYNPADWYWAVGDDQTKVWSSAATGYVPVDDQAYADWKAATGFPARPIASEADVRDIMKDAGLFFDLIEYAAAARYAVEVAGAKAQVGGKTVTVSTRRDDRDGLRDTMTAILAGLRKDGATFKFVEGPRAVTNDEMKAAVATAFAHVQGAYDTEGAVATDIAAGKVKTRADVDAAFAA